MKLNVLAGMFAALMLAVPAEADKGRGKGRKPSKATIAAERARSVARTARSYLPEENAGRKRPRDCSDFVRMVYGAHRVELPRTSQEMSVRGRRVASSKELKMGDLVFFSGEKISRIVGHVGIYINNGIFIHQARREVGVRMESLYSDHYRKRYLSARRIL